MNNCMHMDTDNRVLKAWGGGEGGLEVNGDGVGDM